MIIKKVTDKLVIKMSCDKILYSLFMLSHIRMSRYVLINSVNYRTRGAFRLQKAGLFYAFKTAQPRDLYSEIMWDKITYAQHNNISKTSSHGY